MIRTRTAIGVHVLAVIAAMTSVSPSAADVGNPNYTVTASSSTQDDAPAPGPLTNVVSGETVNVTITSRGDFNVNGAQLRLCRAGVEIDSESEFTADTSPNCIFPPLDGTSDFFTEASAPPPFTSLTLGLRIGTGTGKHEWDDGSGSPKESTITCGLGNPCALWVRVGVNPGLNVDSNLWYHFDLEYGSAPGEGTICGLLRPLAQLPVFGFAFRVLFLRFGCLL